MRNIEELTIENMDVYYPLTQKRDLIKKISAEYFEGELMDLGCGRMPYKSSIMQISKIKSYTGVDIKNDNYQKDNTPILPDIFWDGITIPCEDNKFNSCILIEVLEHIPQPQNVLNEINRVMAKDGHLLITVPFLWNLHDIPNDEYRYTPFALKRMLEESGFEVVKLEHFGGWHTSMATMISLYVRRGLQRNKYKDTLSKLMLPVIKYLMKKDAKTDKTLFDEGQMITGLWCLAKKNNK